MNALCVERSAVKLFDTSAALIVHTFYNARIAAAIRARGSAG